MARRMVADLYSVMRRLVSKEQVAHRSQNTRVTLLLHPEASDHRNNAPKQS